ncbi:MAG: ribose transport system permease protein [Baekduia sp.]|nr:ribose transport system permease protein [Baekduia sp.]
MSADALAPRTAEPARGSGGGSSGSRPLRQVLLQREAGLAFVTIAVFAFFSLSAPHFFGLANVYDIARVTTYTLIVAVPMTYLFIAGEFDMSVGPSFALCNVFMALLVADHGVNPWLAALAAIGLGMTIGAVNGFVTTVIGVPSFIVTLGMLSVLSGIALVVTGATAVPMPDGIQSSFFSATNGIIGPLGDLPVSILWGLAVALIGACFLRYTRFGYHVYATGGNADAARAAGISPRKVKFLCFVLTGAACGLVGALQAGWLKEGDPTIGSDFTLLVMAATIIGGVALTGGAGSVSGTLLGAWIIGMLANGLILLGVESNWNKFFNGVIIVLVASGELALKNKDRLRGMLRTLPQRLGQSGPARFRSRT